MTHAGDVLRPPADGASLTTREREVAELLELGLTNKQIARRLSIRLATAKNHVHNILAKLKVGRRGEAVAALRGGHVAGAATERGEDVRWSVAM